MRQATPSPALCAHRLGVRPSSLRLGLLKTIAARTQTASASPVGTKHRAWKRQGREKYRRLCVRIAAMPLQEPAKATGHQQACTAFTRSHSWTPVPPVCPAAAADCRRTQDANIKCTPVNCSKAGSVVPLAGTCTSAFRGAPFTFYVNGAATTQLTCPAQGVQVLVEPKIENFNAPACLYRKLLNHWAACQQCSSPFGGNTGGRRLHGEPSHSIVIVPRDP